jgi:hypothetical protein
MRMSLSSVSRKHRADDGGSALAGFAVIEDSRKLQEPFLALEISLGFLLGQV